MDRKQILALNWQEPSPGIAEFVGEKDEQLSAHFNHANIEMEGLKEFEKDAIENYLNSLISIDIEEKENQGHLGKLYYHPDYLDTFMPCYRVSKGQKDYKSLYRFTCTSIKDYIQSFIADRFNFSEDSISEEDKKLLRSVFVSMEQEDTGDRTLRTEFRAVSNIDLRPVEMYLDHTLEDLRVEKTMGNLV